MGSAMHRTLEYLGLAQPQGRMDEDYDVEDYDLDEQLEMSDDSGSYATVSELRRPSVGEVVAPTRVGGLSRITTIHPRTYNEAKTIGENFREGVPVIMNLTDMTDAEAKRLVDFAAGLVFGLHGDIERVTNKVFLLSPRTVAINAEGAGPGAARGVFNQS